MPNSKNRHTCSSIITFGSYFYLKYKCGFYSPITSIQSGQTNTQTNTHNNRVLII